MPCFSEIDSIKKNKKSTEFWIKSVNDILSDFEQVIKEAAYERSLKENPTLSEKLWNEYSPIEKKVFYENYYDIKTEIMDVIYLNDPDWLRIVKIFEEVRTDVLTVIDKMDLAQETKHIMKEKVSSVKISLPYEDRRKTDKIMNCATHLKNAYYNLVQNSFFFCIGTVNTSGNDGSFYGTIAHELSHSIDPHVFLQDVLNQTSILRLLSQLYESNASLSCENWEKQKSEDFVLPSETYQLPEGIAAIDQCLVDRQHLSELNHSSLDYASQRMAEAVIDSDASQQNFSYLTTPKFFKDGDLKNNEFYMEPKLFAESKNTFVEVKYFFGGFFIHLLYLFKSINVALLIWV